MKYQPKKNYKSDDVVMTPPNLAEALVKHFKPQGKGLEPCCGCGNILRLLDNADWCEITEGKDFFEYQNKVDYIFTNPPWSQIRPFLTHSMELANDIYFLFTINHLWTKARLRDIKNHNFGIVEICIFDTPKEFPQSGFQCGMVHLKKNYNGEIVFSRLEKGVLKMEERCVICGREIPEDRQYCVICGEVMPKKKDMVEVVRCEKCKYCEVVYPYKEIGEEPIKGHYCKLYNSYKKPTDFCSYGELKEREG